MKVVVDFDLCESNALCVDACPEVFGIDENEFLIVREDQVNEGIADALEQAARVCPRQAITIED
jgi:ferredoxin